MKGYRLRYKPAGPKDDNFDAFVLADLLWRDRDMLAQITPEIESVQRLKALLADRTNFIYDQSSFRNRLTAALREYYPAALELFADPAGKTALAFVEAYPNLESTRTLDRDTLKALLVKHHSYSPKRLLKMLKVLTQQWIPVSPIVVEMRQRVILHLIRQLRQIQEAIDAYDTDIEQAMAGNPEIARFQPLPAAGPIVCSTLYIILGEDRTRYQSAIDVQSYVGTAPRTIQSGQFCKVAFRHACRQDYRVVLTRWAFSTLRVCPWARKYYNKKRKEGKGHYYALRCLANILLRIAFAVWKNRTNYNEDHHLAQIMRHRMNNETTEVSKRVIRGQPAERIASNQTQA